MSKWKYGLLNCCGAPLACLWSCLIPFPFGIACMQATTAKLLINKDKAQLKACCCAVSFCCFGIAYNRSEIREVLQIKGNLFKDLIFAILCPCCSMVREWREVMSSKGLDEDTPIWKARAGYEQVN